MEREPNHRRVPPPMTVTRLVPVTAAAPVQRAARRIRLILAAVLIPVGIALAVAMVMLWPSGRVHIGQAVDAYSAPGAQTGAATVSSVAGGSCDTSDVVGALDGEVLAGRCAQVSAVVDFGPDAGSTQRFQVPPAITRAGISPGDRVEVVRVPAADGVPTTYAFVDFARGVPLAAMAGVFALVVIVVARARGVAALLGLAVAYVVMARFVVPALAHGRPGLVVAVVAAGVMVYVVLYLAHGVSVRTTTALVGTLAGIAAMSALAWWATAALHLTGTSSEDNVELSQINAQVHLSELVTAGIIIAGIGVLNDVTVTQASAAWELHAAHPAQGSRQLFAATMRVGRDHIASTVYTIVFAYAGAALPLLLLVNAYARPLGSVLTSEVLAEEIARTLAAGIGLVLAVPLTTLIAVGLIRAGGAGAAVTEPAGPPRAQG